MAVKKILVVDDSPTERAFIEDMGVNWGRFDVLVAE